MDSDRWKKVERFLDRVIELAPQERQRYLDLHCHDPVLRREVDALLDAHGAADTFLQRPAGEYAATLIDRVQHAALNALLGEVIDGYRIVEVLGRGGMGVVYKAVEERIARMVAIKVIAPELSRHREVVRRFWGEARAQARINSPHIVTVHAFKEWEIGLSIVMEYVDGGTMEDLAFRGAVPWPQALPLIKQILAALEHAHAVKVVHRDIKPQNIMLNRSSVVKVTDFGIAQMLDPDVTQTIVEGTLGTPSYMAPEQVRGEPVDHRLDVWAVGVILFELLAGARPFTAETLSGLQYLIVHEPPEHALLERAQVPEGLRRIVLKALEKDPDRRFQQASEMRRALERFEVAIKRQEAQPTAALGAQEAAPPDQGDRQWPLYGVAGGVLSVLLAGLIYFFWPPGGPSGPGGGPQATRATLRVMADPHAQLLVDDSLLVDVPGELALEAGAYPVECRYGSYAADTTLTLQPSQPAEVRCYVQGTVVIESDPEGAFLLVDGERTGEQTPAVMVLEPGAHLISVSKAGYEETEGTTVSVRPAFERSTHNLFFELEKAKAEPPPVATLRVSADRPGQVVVDGARMEGTSAERALRPGRHVVQCGEGAFASEATFTLATGEARDVKCYLQNAVSIGSVPDAAAIFVDDTSIGAQTPWEIELGPGEHRISVNKFGYEAAGDTLLILRPAFGKKQHHRLSFRLTEQ